MKEVMLHEKFDSANHIFIFLHGRRHKDKKIMEKEKRERKRKEVRKK